MNHCTRLATATLAAFLASLADAQQTADDIGGPGKAMTMLAAAVPVTNLDRTLAFYTKGLGMQATPRRDTKDVTEEPLTFPGGGSYLILLLPMTPASPPYSPPVTQRVILDVPDLKSLEAQLKANGYRLDGPVNENPQYHYAVGHISDPDGNHLELVQRTH